MESVLVRNVVYTYVRFSSIMDLSLPKIWNHTISQKQNLHKGLIANLQ
jgi:hypothetical protein